MPTPAAKKKQPVSAARNLTIVVNAPGGVVNVESHRSTVTANNGNPLLEAAVAYARAGIPVFPCRERDEKDREGKLHKAKKPYTRHGYKDASVSEKTIVAWWTKWPNAMIGMPTGNITGVFVVDPDGPVGEQSLTALIERHGPLPKTKQIRTGRPEGGRHIYFKAPPGVKIKSTDSELGEKVDVRGDGGLVILPPSVHPSGLVYTGINDLLPADPPVWLLERVRDGASRQQPIGANKNSPAGDDKIPYGQHRETLVRIAGRLRHDGLEEKALTAALIEICEKRCVNYGEDYKEMCARIAGWGSQKPTGDGPAGHEPFRSDVANAALYAEMHAGRVIWCADREIWYAWDGKRFAANNVGEVMRRGRETVKRLYEIAIDLPAGEEGSDAAKARKAAFHRASSAERTIPQFIRLARSEPALEAMKFGESFDLDAYLFNCAVGTVNLRTGDLLPPDPAKRITMLSPIGYDPNATAPQFEMFLLHACAGSKDLLEYLVRLMGYFLSGLTDEQSFWLFQGPSKTSKTTFINVIRGLMGDYATTLPESAVMMNPRTNEEHGLAQLAGVRLATMVEIGQGKRYDEAKLKQITGQDIISASKKYQNYFEFTSKAKLAMAGNHLPKVHDTDDSIWNRIKRVPFNVAVPPAERVKNLHLKLLAEEGPGILALAVRGFQRWAKDGFTEPKEIKDAINEYREGQDVVLQFVDEECERGAEKRVECGRLFSAFISWKDRNGFKTSWSKTAFGLELKRLNFEAKHSTGRWYTGLALLNHAGPDEKGEL